MAKEKMITKVFEAIGKQVFVFTSETIRGIVFGIANAAANPELKFYYSDAAAMLHAGIIEELKKETDRATNEMVAYIIAKSKE